MKRKVEEGLVPESKGAGGSSAASEIASRGVGGATDLSTSAPKSSRSALTKPRKRKPKKKR